MRRTTVRTIGLALGAAAMLAVAAGAGAASDPKDVVKCKQALAKTSTKFIQTKTKILSKCELEVIKGKLPPLTDCHAAWAADIAAAETKVHDGVLKACCGDDDACGTSDDVTLAEIGITDPSCPDSEGGHAPASACGDILLADASDLGDCLVCIGEEHVDESISLYFDALVPSDPDADKALNKCQQAIGKTTAAFLGAKSKALAKCWDGRLKAKHSNACPSPGDGKAQAAIDKAESKKIAGICKACGGEDKLCSPDTCQTGNVGAPCELNAQCGPGGVCGDDGSDFTAAQIGFPSTCPALLAGNPIGQQVRSLEKLIDCVDVSTSNRVECTDASAVPSLRTLPAFCERTPEPCQTDGTPVDLQVTFSSASAVGAISVALGYNTDEVVLPGSGEAVGSRVTNQQSGTSAVSSDSDDTLVVSIAGIDPFTPPDLFQVEFDHCTGTVTSADFACIVRDASDPSATALTDVTCTASVIP